MAISTGDSAPDFTLPSSGSAGEGERIALSDLCRQRTVVLYFYPKDDTPGCTVEACSFRDRYEAFCDAGAEVVGVSSDSYESHRRFADRHGLPMRLVSDPDGALRRLYDVRATLGILPGRATFVIDRQMTVRHVFVSQLRFGRHVEEALETVRRLEHEAQLPSSVA